MLCWSRALDKTGFWYCHLGLQLNAWLVEAWCRGWVSDGALEITLPLPTGPFFPLKIYSLSKYFLDPILHSYQIQDGGLIWKFLLAHPLQWILTKLHIIAKLGMINQVARIFCLNEKVRKSWPRWRSITAFFSCFLLICQNFYFLVSCLL